MKLPLPGRRLFARIDYSGAGGALIVAGIQLVTWARVIYLLAWKSNAGQRAVAVLFIFQFAALWIWEVTTGDKVLHFYQIQPHLLLILIILAGMILAIPRLVPIFILAIAMVVSHWPEVWLNENEKVLREVAQQINEKSDSGCRPVFAGSPVYFVLFPWLSSPTVRNSAVVVDGSGFYGDAFEGSNLLPPSVARNSRFIVEANERKSCYVIVSPKLSQGFAVDLDSRWQSDEKIYVFPSLNTLGMIHLNYLRTTNEN